MDIAIKEQTSLKSSEIIKKRKNKQNAYGRLL
jgi:hypothetical protein